ncbi:MAG: hypothetical protein HYU86_04250 [Chloroflexi bacterium]|nr:hypothetical protein [Chloroflexota bacterium]
MNILVPALSTVVALFFAAAVFDQYVARRRPYQLVWAFALLIFGLATSQEFLAEIGGWYEVGFKLWYLTGAILVAAYLGTGTVYLLLPRSTGHVVMVLLSLVSLYAIYRVVQVPIADSSLLTAVGQVRPQAMPQDVRLITAVFNIYGTIALVGGALYSAWDFWRKGTFPHRVVSNVLIALGAIIVAASGSLATLGNPSYLFIGELLGLVVIFIGFLRSQEVFGLYRLPFTQGMGQVQ